MREREREDARQREADRLEAEEVRRLAAEWAAEQRRKAEARREAAARQAADNVRQIEDSQLVKHIDAMQEEVVCLYSAL